MCCNIVLLHIVLVFSYLFGGKSYGASKCVTVFLIVSGVTIFMYKEVGPVCVHACMCVYLYYMYIIIVVC